MRKILLFFCLFLMPMGVFAEESAEDKLKSELHLNIRRLGLELSKTSVSNAADYADSPIQQLKANSQDVVKTIADMALEYKHGKFGWNNSLFAEYGKTTLRPYNAPISSDESADKVLLSSDLSYACWDSGWFKFGPIARTAYETEFTGSGNVPRRNVSRTNAGLSIFDHNIIKDLYVAGVYEYDFTYAEEKTSKAAAEFGWRIEYEIREGVKLSTNGYYREYLAYSHYNDTDLERDFSGVIRLDTNLFHKFTMGPYAQYRRAKSREADVYGSNFVIGVSFNYINKIGLR